jgi:hypothetical protein
MMSYPDYDDYGTYDQVGYGLGPGDCPACGAPPGEQHGCSLADRSSVTGRHPEVTVHLTGTDGSASAVMGRVQRALRDAGAPQREVDQFRLDDQFQGSSSVCASLMATGAQDRRC